MDHPDTSIQQVPGTIVRSTLPGGLSCLAIAYPAIAATGHARLALAAGVGSMATLLLTWAVLVLLRRVNRFRYSDLAAVLTACLLSSLVWLGMQAAGWIPDTFHPLPLLAAPVLLLFEALPLLRTGTEKWERQTPLRLIMLAASAATVYIGVGIVREWMVYGSIFASSTALQPGTASPFSVPLGWMLAGLLMGGFRWVAGRATTMVKGGSKA